MYFTDVGFDTPNSNNHLIISMLEGFLEEGHTVYLFESHSSGEYSDVPEKLLSYSQFEYDTVDKIKTKRKNFVGRYLASIVFEIKAWKKWKKKIKDVDVVIVQSHFTAVFTVFFLKIYRKKIIFSIFDIFPGEAYTNGSIKSKFVYNVFSVLQKRLYKNSDYIITLTNDTKNTLVELGVEDEKLVIVPNWYDEKRIHIVEFDNNSFVKEFGLKQEKKYVQYAGTVGVAYDFDLIIKVAILLRGRPNIVFQIVGEGLFLDDVKKKVKENSLTNVQFIPWQPLEKLSDVYSSCSLQIIPLKREVIFNSYPSKILPLMACGRIPIISVEEGSMFFHEINNERIGVAIPLGDENLMAEVIVKLLDDNKLRQTMEKNALRFVKEKYSSLPNIEKIMKVLYRAKEEE